MTGIGSGTWAVSQHRELVEAAVLGGGCDVLRHTATVITRHPESVRVLPSRTAADDLPAMMVG